MQVEIDRQSLEELRFRLRGELYEPGQAEYEDTCTLFDSTPERRPALVARCTAVDDVVAACAFARVHGLAVAACVGGQSGDGRLLSDDVLVIDLRGMLELGLRP